MHSMSKSSDAVGTLYIVPTPLGNLHDITLRALTLLKEVDWIAAEDTRHSGPLLQHYGITTPLKSLHEHNEPQRVEWIQNDLAAGKNIALISDAGTPLICDPGYRLVSLLRETNDIRIAVVPLPGACAAITALSASGLATDHFIFEGFLSSKAPARLTQLQARQKEPYTLIYYEAPHRLMETLAAMKTVFGKERRISIARELTKTFESFYWGTIPEVEDYFSQHPEEQRGEIVILVSGASERTQADEKDAESILKILLKEMPLKKAAHLAAEITGVRKNKLYSLGLTLSSA